MVERNKVPVTVTLDPVDVDLLDRLATLGGSNRSVELRALLEQLRPMIRQTVEALERAQAARGALTEAAARATLEQFEKIAPRVQRIQEEVLGAMATLEGAAAAEDHAALLRLAEAVQDDEDPRPSNHGGHTPTPPPAEGPR